MYFIEGVNDLEKMNQLKQAIKKLNEADGTDPCI